MENVDASTVDSWIQGIDDDIERVSSSPKAGTRWYIVSMRWLTRWRQQFGLKIDDMDLDKDSEPSPSDLNNVPNMLIDDPKVYASPDSNHTGLEELKTDNITESLDSESTEPKQKPLVTQNIEDQPQIGPVNSEDILDVNPAYEPDFVLKKGLCLGVDYEILPPKAWEYFNDRYGAIHEIIRTSIQVNKKETKVEISLKPIRLLYIHENAIKSDLVILHVSIKESLQGLMRVVKNLAVKRCQMSEQDIGVWIWKCFQGTSSISLQNKLKSSQNLFPGTCLKGNDEVYNLEIAEDDLLVAEIVDVSQKSAYKPASQGTLESSLASNARRGITGLQNLGNTCFMNSGLQCLSNTYALTEFILNNSYRSQINTNNRIGSKGKIITAYAELIKEMWTGSASSVSPWSLKKALGSFASQFIGYSQQDSQEMLSFLIDGIHEDLNQAPKPTPTDINETGLSEREIADKYWEKHLDRNQSIIVDLMHGQYRSEVTCLECNGISVAFDPFLMLTLPVPQKETMHKEVTIIIGNTATPYKLEIPYACRVRDLVRRLPEELRSENYIAGEAEGYSKEIKRIIGKNEIVEKHRDLVIFHHPPVEENNMIVLCNFSSKSYNEHYGCGSPLGLTKVFILNKTTIQDLHLALYKDFIREIDQKELSDEELVQSFQSAFPSLFSDKKDDLYILNAYNPGRHPCIVCMKETCYGCRLPFKDEPIEQYITRSKDPCLFLNVIFMGEKSKINSKVSGLAYKRNSLIEERTQQSTEARGLTLDDCLKSFEEVEELDDNNTIYCRRCKKHVRGTKKMDLYKLPNYLIIHLKRFKRHGYSCQKNGAQVSFPVEGLIVKTHSEESISYDLYAVSNHFGSMGGGHYTAYGKNINGNWYDFNDSSASLLRDKSSITSSAAYVLFYKRSNLRC